MPFEALFDPWMVRSETAITAKRKIAPPTSASRRVKPRSGAVRFIFLDLHRSIAEEDDPPIDGRLEGVADLEAIRKYRRRIHRGHPVDVEADGDGSGLQPVGPLDHHRRAVPAGGEPVLEVVDPVVDRVV